MAANSSILHRFFLSLGILWGATLYGEGAPDQKAYEGSIKGIEQGYQAALTRNGTDAAYNGKLQAIEDAYNRRLAELGFGPSIRVEGHFGKGTNTDVAIPNIGMEKKDEQAPVAATGPKPKILGIAP